MAEPKSGGGGNRTRDTFPTAFGSTKPKPGHSKVNNRTGLNYIPAERVARLIALWSKQVGHEQARNNGTKALAMLTGTSERAIWRIRSAESSNVSLDLADRLLIAMGLEHYWHLPAEDGGLADYYHAPLGEIPEPSPTTERCRELSQLRYEQRRRKELAA